MRPNLSLLLVHVLPPLSVHCTVEGQPWKNGSKRMALQPLTGISLECLKVQATEDMQPQFVTYLLQVSTMYMRTHKYFMYSC